MDSLPSALESRGPISSQLGGIATSLHMAPVPGDVVGQAEWNMLDRHRIEVNERLEAAALHGFDPTDFVQVLSS